MNDMQFIATSQIPNNLTVTTSTDCTEVYVGDYRQMVIGLREDVSMMRADQLDHRHPRQLAVALARLPLGCRWLSDRAAEREFAAAVRRSPFMGYYGPPLYGRSWILGSSCAVSRRRYCFRRDRCIPASPMPMSARVAGSGTEGIAR